MKQMKKYIITSFVLLATAIFSIGCSKNKDVNPIAKINIKDYGTITAELYPEYAPNTVNNFIELSKKGFYNNLIFHRVIKDFVIQGGDPDGIGTGGPGYSIKGEFAHNGYTDNSLSHTKGVLSMARSVDNDSAGSQFFIVSGEATYLDGEYAGFGKVIDGIDIVNSIENVDTYDNDKPKKDIIIESITIEDNGYKYNKVEKIK